MPTQAHYDEQVTQQCTQDSGYGDLQPSSNQI